MTDFSYDAILEEVEVYRARKERAKGIVSFKVQGFEDLNDMDRYVEQALHELDIPGEFQGTIRVTFEYEPYEEEEVVCEHEWVSADNKVVSGGIICTKCHTVKAGTV